MSCTLVIATTTKKSKLLNFCFLTYSGLYHTDQLGELPGLEEWGTDRQVLALGKPSLVFWLQYHTSNRSIVSLVFWLQYRTGNRSISTAAGQMYLGLAAVTSGLFQLFYRPVFRAKSRSVSGLAILPFV